MIQEVIDGLANGKITTADVRQCKVNGKEVYEAFICTVNDWILVVQADKSDVLAPIYTISMWCIIIGLILLAVCLVIGFAVTTAITKPIVALTSVINEISELNMSVENNIPQTNDEIGTMAAAVGQMQKHLSGIVGELNGISGLLVSGEMMPDALIYISIVGGGLFIQACYNVMLQILRCNGHTKVGMYITMAINVINIVGNFSFLYGPLKFLNLGVAGVFIGTATDECIRGLIVMRHWKLKKWMGKALVEKS